MFIRCVTLTRMSDQLSKSTRIFFFGLAGASLLAHFTRPAAETDAGADLLASMYLDKLLFAATVCAVCVVHGFCVDDAPQPPSTRFFGAPIAGKVRAVRDNTVHLLRYCALPTATFAVIAAFAGVGCPLGALFGMKLDVLARVVFPEHTSGWLQWWKRAVQYCTMWVVGLLAFEGILLVHNNKGLLGMLYTVPTAPFCNGVASVELILVAVICSTVMMLEGVNTSFESMDMMPQPPPAPSKIERKAWTSDSITLQWGALEDKTSQDAGDEKQQHMQACMFGEKSYELLWRSQMCIQPERDSGPWSLASDCLKQPMVKKKNLKDGSIYAFRVRARHSLGWGGYSIPVVFRCKNSGHEQYPVFATLDLNRMSKGRVCRLLGLSVLNVLTGCVAYGAHVYTFPYH